jgi:hypothetical protein
MPPASLNSPPTADTGHMLSQRRQRSGIGAITGIIIILILVVFGGLYFWGAYLNRTNSTDQLPFIPENPPAGGSTQEAG